MNQVVEHMSDAELLGVVVGSKAAAQLLKDAQGSLSIVLNESVAPYTARPKSAVRLQAAKELVRRSLIEVMRQRCAVSSPSSVRDGDCDERDCRNYT